MCMHSLLIGGEPQAAFLLKAQEAGLTNGRYIFVPYDSLLYSLPYANTSYPVLQNNKKLRLAYDAVLTITVASELMSFNEAYSMAQRMGEFSTAPNPQQVNPTVLSEIGFLQVNHSDNEKLCI